MVTMHGFPGKNIGRVAIPWRAAGTRGRGACAGGAGAPTLLTLHAPRPGRRLGQEQAGHTRSDTCSVPRAREVALDCGHRHRHLRADLPEGMGWHFTLAVNSRWVKAWPDPGVVAAAIRLSGVDSFRVAG